VTEPDFLRSTRASYNAVATDYAERFRDELAAKPLDRALLAGFAGLVAWYSTIHIPSEQLPAVFTEFHRVPVPGGQLLIAFQVGDELLHLSEALGHEISLDFHRRRPEHVAELLSRAGLPVRARMLREPDDVGDFLERTPRAFLLARKPAELSAA
jgi:hypothetical protein